MVDKLVIFNVWWAMSAYCEKLWKKILIDIGKRDDFSPIEDFLLPYFKVNNYPKSPTEGKQNMYHIDQLIISHPHKDHLSDIQNYSKYFYPSFVTTPNDNEWMWGEEKLNWDLVIWKNEIDIDVKYFKDNFIVGRKPPLKSIINDFEIYYIPPKKIEKDIETSDYVNNTSLVCIVDIWWIRIMLPWDIMKSWFEWMMANGVVSTTLGSTTEVSFKRAISKRGVDVLVAPHHWLKSAFSTDIMNDIKDNLNLIVIPEKPTPEDAIRQVDKRYYSWEYGSWVNIEDYETGEVKKQWWIKTSLWHILIWNWKILKVSNDKNLVSAFINL